MNTPVDQIPFPDDTALAYLALAGATCVVYDHLTTLAAEARNLLLHYWFKWHSYLFCFNRPKWRIPQALFIINRYVGLAMQMYVLVFYIKNLLRESTQPALNHSLVCLNKILCYVNQGTTLNLIDGFLAAILFFTMHGIMVFRISSMYTHDRKILRILIVAYMTEFLSVMTIQLVKRMLVAKVNSSEVSVQPSGPFCAKEHFTSWNFVVWLPLMLFECLIFVMFSGYRNSNRKTPLLYILLRDSISFPFLFSLSCIINCLIFLQAGNKLRPVMAHISSLFPVVLSIIFGSRLILNLQESYYESYGSEFSIQIDTSIQFESNRGSVPFPTQIPLSNFATPPTIDN
ncbi:hypothetical protein BJ912DRAFT_960471 [Pholiota molesta]|nr:hypothetical protein BJ912DRAFT_960471 [Pholiota molesta]